MAINRGTIEGICQFYHAQHYIIYTDGRVAVYNAVNDNFHFFRWQDSRYVYCGKADTIPNWKDHRVAI